MVAHAFHRVAALGQAAGLHGEVFQIGSVDFARIVFAQLLLQPVRHRILPGVEAFGDHVEAVGNAPGDLACDVLHSGVAEQVEHGCEHHLNCRLRHIRIGHFGCARFMLDRELGQLGLLHECPGVVGRGDFARIVFCKVGEVRETVRHSNLQSNKSLITLMKDAHRRDAGVRRSGTAARTRCRREQRGWGEPILLARR